MREFYRFPAYYAKFRCIADKCTDSCCIGWEIDIDEETADIYGELIEGDIPEDIKKRMTRNIDLDSDPPHFILGKEERCPFLNDRNLCDLILTFGEDALCQICTDHPRFFEWYPNGTEAGIGLCCEEAARLILTEDDTLLTKWYETDDGETAAFANESVEAQAEIDRQVLFNSRESLMESLELSDAVSPADICRNLKFLSGLEINTVEWENLLNDMSEMYAALSDEAFAELLQRFESENPEAHSGYRKLLRYFIYRYFMKNTDMDTEKFAGIMSFHVNVIRCMDLYHWRKAGTLSLRDRIENCKFYSKEVEYCEKNIEKIGIYIV